MTSRGKTTSFPFQEGTHKSQEPFSLSPFGVTEQQITEMGMGKGHQVSGGRQNDPGSPFPSDLQSEEPQLPARTQSSVLRSPLSGKRNAAGVKVRGNRALITNKIYFRPQERREAMGQEGEGGGEEPAMAAAGKCALVTELSSHTGKAFACST